MDEFMQTFNVYLLWFYETTLWIVIIYLSVQFLVCLVSSLMFFLRYRSLGSERIDHIMDSSFVPEFNLFIPAYNEGHHIAKNVACMLTLKYANLKVIVVNDGSTDNTLQELRREFDLVQLPPVIPGSIETKKIKNYYVSRKNSNLIVIDKENGGKADSLNAALNISTAPYFVSADADTYFDHKAFLEGIYFFLTLPKCIAAGGPVSILNENVVTDDKMEVKFPKKKIFGIQTLEYMRSFFEYRAMGTKFTGSLVIPGSCALFNREAVDSIGGYSTDTVTEDLDIVMRLNKEMRKRKISYSINFIPALIAWTTVPETLKALFFQRERWQRGTLQCLWRKKSMIFNPYYGKEGLLGMPYLVAETIGCLLEITCYILIPILIAFGILNWMIAALFILISFSLGIIRTTLTNLIEQLTFRRYPKTSDVLRILFCGLLEHLGFHQTVLVARIQAFGRAFKRDQSWRREEAKVEQDQTHTQTQVKAAG